MKRIFRACAWLCMLAPLAAHAQLRVVPLVPPPGKTQGGPFRVPLVVGTPAAVAARINLWFQYTQFEVVAGKDNAWMNDLLGDPIGFVSFDYSVSAQTSNVLTLSMQSEYMGAYPSSARFTQAFDLGSGRPVQITDLFTPLGLRRFTKRVIREHVKAIRDDLASEASTLANGNADDRESYQDQRDAYRKCIGYMLSGGLGSDQLALGEKTLGVTHDCGFPHVIQALDDLGPMTATASYDSLKPELSAYGTCLLIEHRSGCRPATRTLHAGVYTGVLGTHTPITLIVVGQPGISSVQAVYFYDHVRKPIALYMSAFAPGSVTLDQPPGGGASNRESFHLQIRDNGDLEGTWTRPGQAPMPVTLAY